ncbi:TIGR02281 family clan AA aspartic protease [Alkalilimnicola sp. S0819]|uniref:TIGR02281 family clan AA aspartic protease n=1 Tax=Alkalilimnicola sp. S0819 TaxID=2613922 RepID=UPI001D001DBA|nr:TIGR02281 family clan AA aspartic protease [Alkalilimnicola sp. S0819]
MMLLLCLCAGLVQAAPRLELVGLFPGRAVLTVDGRRHVLAEGERSPEGVRLVRVEGQAAWVSFAGQQRRLPMSRSVGGSYAAPSRNTVSIARDRHGMFTTTGSINGTPVSWLVDTGATVVAFNAEHARRLGIDFRRDGLPVQVNTASGTARAWRVTLESVAVGGIVVRKVAAVVMDGSSPRVPLLGMSYLGRLKMSHEGRLLVLEAIY